MSKFTTADTNRMDWQELDGLVDVLIQKVDKYFNEKGQKVSIVTPLLRSGGICGGLMAIKMHVFTMLPVQFKYSYNPTKINQIISVPDLLIDIPDPMNVLLCEGNTNSGSIAVRAAKAIKEKYPQAKIYLATLTKVFGGPESLEGIDQVFYGCQTDENFKATDEEKKKFELRHGITLFPWENAQDELADINNEL